MRWRVWERRARRVERVCFEEEGGEGRDGGEGGGVVEESPMLRGWLEDGGS